MMGSVTMTAARSVTAAMLAVLGSDDSQASASSRPAHAQSVTTAQVADCIGQPGWLIVDVRDSNAFNGWITGDEQRGGSIPGAVNLALSWFESNPQAAQRLIESMGLKQNKVVLYGNSAAEAQRMTRLLQQHAQIPAERLFVYTDGIAAWSRDDNLPMDRLPRYERLVPPVWLQQLVQQGDPRDYQVVEVAWRKKQRYESGHIPGAVYLDTDEIESESLWNVVSPEQLERTLLSLGITKDTLVVVYGRDSTPATRAALVLMYAGVADVRLLNGGYAAWQNAGLATVIGDVAREPARVFAATVPVHPEWIIDTTQAKQVLAARDGRLVSIRSWSEYVGQTSGYSYIKPKGRIRGAVWGHAGTDRDHMQDFRNPDDTLRNFRDIAALWRDWDIEPQHRISFYCGTGWRASEAFLAAYLMGYENISVYDGGWYEWSADENNPVETGTPSSSHR